MPSALRCLNIVNFIRKKEPRFPMDMMEPVREQMAILKDLELPATWPIQYDALVGGPFCAFLQQEMPPSHEAALWFEMNEPLCRAAGMPWRGRPGYEWDWHPPVAYTLGYTPEERIHLADAAVEGFVEVWGRPPTSVCCWNLDAIVVAHFAEQHGVAAFAVCRDQIATDGYTIWGAPFAGWLPSRVNAWSPAQSDEDQIGSPILRMLGQDPVYSYDSSFPLPDGRVISEPDTLEPAWSSAHDPFYVSACLKMFEEGPSGNFAYVQLGQENTFEWRLQDGAYQLQMRAAKEIAMRGLAHVETMSSTGMRFKEAFRRTPSMAQVQLVDPFGHTTNPQATLWRCSPSHRVNLHLSEGTAWLRDITLYRQGFEQPFLHHPTTEKDVEQRMLSGLDAFHWRPSGSSPSTMDCGGYLMVAGKPFSFRRVREVRETDTGLEAWLEGEEGVIQAVMEDDQLVLRGPESLVLDFRWDSGKASFRGLEGREVRFVQDDYAYGFRVREGSSSLTASGWQVESASGLIVLDFASSRDA